MRAKDDEKDSFLTALDRSDCANRDSIMVFVFFQRGFYTALTADSSFIFPGSAVYGSGCTYAEGMPSLLHLI